jgi:pilus assembly protein Flp/PilA
MGKMRKLIGDNRGATAIEYALVASLISVAALGAFQSLGGGVARKYVAVDQAVGDALETR